MIKRKEVRSLIDAFVLARHVDNAPTEIGVHQIRVTVQEFSTSPVPEGLHQDGFDSVSIFCVHREGIVGGETHIFQSKEGSPFLSHLLLPGEMLSFNDRSLFHFTDDVRSSAGCVVQGMFSFLQQRFCKQPASTNMKLEMQ